MLKIEFLRRKIKLIQEDLSELESLSTLSFEEMTEKSLNYYATERLLERIVTRAIDINNHIIAEKGTGKEEVRRYQDSFLRLADLGVYPQAFAEAIAPSAGLRNILVHDYDGVAPRMIYDSVKDALSQYAEYCRFVLACADRE